VGQTPPFPGAKHAVTFDGATGAIDLGDRFGFVGVAPYSIEVWDLPGTVDGRAFYELASKWRVRTATTPASGWNLFYSRVPRRARHPPRSSGSRARPSWGRPPEVPSRPPPRTDGITWSAPTTGPPWRSMSTGCSSSGTLQRIRSTSSRWICCSAPAEVRHSPCCSARSAGFSSISTWVDAW
jgi:hypothetical protein